MSLTPEQLIAELPALRKQLEEAEAEAKRADFAAFSAAARAQQTKERLRVFRDAVASVEALAQVYAPPGDKIRIVPDAVDPRSDVVLTLDDGSTVVVEAKGPRGREAVRRVLRDAGRPMRPKEFITEVKRRQWVDPDARDPDAAIRVAARRLVDDGLVEVQDGLYVYKPSSGTPGDAADSADGQGTLLAGEGGDQ